MAKDEPRKQGTPELRRRAEERLARRPQTPHLRNGSETSHLIHELEVHQVELEMQNEELRQARAELEANYDELYNFAPVGYFTLGRFGDIEKVNPTGAAMLGKTSSSLIDRRFANFVVEDSLQAFNAFLRRLRKSESKESCLVTLIRHGDTAISTYIEAGATKDQTGWRAVVVDITSSEQATQSLRQSEERLDMVLAATGMGVWEWETGSDEIYWSPQCVKLLGLNVLCPKLGMLAPLLDPRDADRVHAAVREALDKGTEQSGQLRIVRPGGEPTTLFVRFQVKRDRFGKVRRLIGIVKEASEPLGVAEVRAAA